VNDQQPAPELPRVTGDLFFRHMFYDSCPTEEWHALEACTIDVEAESARAEWERVEARRRENAHLN
jgi:hypothetical protein